ncbi:MAG: AAA family ATPase [Elusimicrobiota bacterium]
MHLKRLEIHGFKSFADTITLDIEPGITAIVGPNGCGKSNIIDAVRWCLGEMSAKSLRSSAMMDVVFNGSGSRPPQNMAEVTLTFDNSDKRLPIDFTDVSIARRLYRSGESEYYINKTQCRLRDIRELFLDTGMGEDGYSSLEQGKVEWILQAKPEERRELFEEAAGVSKYRARREEALRKLEKVEIDLSRLFDIITVTQDQIRKLENAVTKAKTYERIKGELKVMEVSDWLFQLQNTSVYLTESKEKLQKMSTQSEELRTKSHQLDTEISEQRLKLTQTEEHLLAANTQLNAIDSDLKIGEERLNSSKQREEDLNRQIANLEEALQRETVRLDDLARQLDSHKLSLENLKAEGVNVETEFSESQSKVKSALDQLENKKSEVKVARDLILERAQERSRLQQKINQSISDLTRFESQIESLVKDKSRVQMQMEEVSVQFVTHENQEKSLTEKLVTLETQYIQLTNELSQIEESNDTNKKAVHDKLEAMARLKGLISSISEQQNHDPYLAGAHEIISVGLPGVYGPINKLFHSNEENRDMVAAALGEQLSDLVADTLEDAKRAIDHLKNNGKGRAKIWVLNQLPLSNSESSSFGNSISEKIQCTEKYKPLLNYLCGSLDSDGSTVMGKTFVNGGVEPSSWQSHMIYRLPELEADLIQIQISKGELENTITTSENELVSTKSEKDKLYQELQEARVQKDWVVKENRRIGDRKTLFTRELENLSVESVQIEEQKKQTQFFFDEANTGFNQLQRHEEDDHHALDLLQQELTELQQKHAELNADLTSKTERHNAYLEKLNWQQSVIDHIQVEINQLNLNADRNKKEILSMKSEVELSQNVQKEAQALIEGSVSKRSVASAAVAQIQSERVSLSEQIQKCEAGLSQIRRELSDIQEEVQKEMINESNIHNKQDLVTQKLHDQYELTIELAREQFQAQVADVETLEKLKKRVANIGPINLAAPQEHAELMEKNTFMTTQQADLLKAKDDLKQVIAKINSTTRDHFRETFDKVRENFRNLYGKLFQGGEADLRFTDETDILNTGIDIFCQPPGKKLLHISLLSGGEKALTAIALLFAFFQVRPSPLALMDEVDAPLDEANVLRYVDMLKFFSQNSQFMLISHNKRTMEAANNLFGVTMEELGVSKVLSARLQKASEKQPAAQAVEPANA